MENRGELKSVAPVKDWVWRVREKQERIKPLNPSLFHPGSLTKSEEHRRKSRPGTKD